MKNPSFQTIVKEFEVMKASDKEEDSNKEVWQDFLSLVCLSIEERRKAIKPQSFRPKRF